MREMKIYADIKPANYGRKGRPPISWMMRLCFKLR